MLQSFIEAVGCVWHGPLMRIRIPLVLRCHRGCNCSTQTLTPVLVKLGYRLRVVAAPRMHALRTPLSRPQLQLSSGALNEVMVEAFRIAAVAAL